MKNILYYKYIPSDGEINDYNYDDHIIEVSDMVFTEKDLSSIQRIAHNNFTKEIKSGAVFFKEDLKDFNPSHISRSYKNLITNKGVFIKNTKDCLKANYRIIDENKFDFFYKSTDVKISFDKIILNKILITEDFKDYVRHNYVMFGNVDITSMFNSEYIYLNLDNNNLDEIKKYILNYSEVYILKKEIKFMEYFIDFLLINNRLSHDVHYMTIEDYTHSLSDKKVMGINEYNSLNRLFYNKNVAEASTHLFFNYKVDKTLTKNEIFFTALFYTEHATLLSTFYNKNNKKILYTADIWNHLVEQSRAISSILRPVISEQDIIARIVDIINSYNNEISYFMILKIYDKLKESIDGTMNSKIPGISKIINYDPMIKLSFLGNIKYPDHNEYDKYTKRMVDFIEYCKQMEECPYKISIEM